MYCRECGNQISDSTVACSKCGTRKGVGVNYCPNCGFHTSQKTLYCLNCGAKQNNVMSPQMKKTKLEELQKRSKSVKRGMKIGKFFAVAGGVLTVIFVAVLFLRPQPDNIPDPSGMNISSNSYVHDSLRQIGNTYYYSSDIGYEVAKYWVQGRALIAYAFLSFIICIIGIVVFNVHKSKNKVIQKKIKEAKNVL